MQRLPTDILHDNRGLAMGIIGFVAIIVTIAILYTMFDSAAELMFSTSQTQTNAQEATDAISERKTIWNAMPIYFAFLALVFVISRSVFESRGPG